MTEKQKQILATFNSLLPKLTLLEQEKLLSFGSPTPMSGGRMRKKPPSWAAGRPAKKSQE